MRSPEPPPTSASERARWSRLRRPADRDRLAAGQRLVRAVAAALLDVRSDELRVQRTCPYCGSGDHGPLQVDGCSVSVSHSGGVVVAAASTQASVGVDVEELPAASTGSGPRDLTAQGVLAALHPEEVAEHAARGASVEDLLVRWVRKEAVLKAARTGLRHGAGQLRVTPPWQPPAVVSWSGPGAVRPSRTVLADLEAPPGCVACVAVLAAGPLTVVARPSAALSGST